MSDYLLDQSKELDRLQLQARVWEPEADALFAHMGIARGARALDVGCGAYGVLAALARAVGAEGRVVGLDFDARLLAAARRHVDDARLGNVELVRGDAFALPFPDGSFDVAHLRFMLAPLGRPRALVTELLRVVRPGGLVAVEEPDSLSLRLWPERPRVTALSAALEQAFTRAGGDAGAGRGTFALFHALGLAEVRTRAAVAALPGGHPYLRYPAQMAASLRARLLVELDAAEVDAAVAECEAAAQDPATFATTFVLVQTWGKKR